MLARLPSLILVRLWALLLLACITMQAGKPITTPLEQSHGSAFTALTYEVALSPRRGEDAAAQFQALSPAIPIETRDWANSIEPVPKTQNPPRPDSTGPQIRDVQSWRPAPRAPPIA